MYARGCEWMGWRLDEAGHNWWVGVLGEDYNGMTRDSLLC